MGNETGELVFVILYCDCNCIGEYLNCATSNISYPVFEKSTAVNVFERIYGVYPAWSNWGFINPPDFNCKGE